MSRIEPIVRWTRSNVVPWRSKQQPGYRLNTLKALLSVVMLVLGISEAHLTQGTHLWDFLPASCVMLVTALLAGSTYMVVKLSARWLPSVLAVLAFSVAASLLLVAVVHMTMVNPWAVVLHVILVVAIIACFIATSLTKWWPFGWKSTNFHTKKYYRRQAIAKFASRTPAASAVPPTAPPNPLVTG